MSFCLEFEKKDLLLHPSSRPGGGIGRRAGLKIQCPLKTCGFDSRPGYKKSKENPLGQMIERVFLLWGAEGNLFVLFLFLAEPLLGSCVLDCFA